MGWGRRDVMSGAQVPGVSWSWRCGQCPGLAECGDEGGTRPEFSAEQRGDEVLLSEGGLAQEQTLLCFPGATDLAFPALPRTATSYLCERLIRVCLATRSSWRAGVGQLFFSLWCPPQPAQDLVRSGLLIHVCRMTEWMNTIHGRGVNAPSSLGARMVF